MVQSRIKGNRSRRRAIEAYQQLGWTIDIVEKTGRFIINKDLFAQYGAGFDLVGIKENQTIFIQVKTNNLPVLKDYRNFAMMYAGPNVFIESFSWYDYEGPIICKFLKTGDIIREDYRNGTTKNKAAKTRSHKDSKTKAYGKKPKTPIKV